VFEDPSVFTNSGLVAWTERLLPDAGSGHLFPTLGERAASSQLDFPPLGQRVRPVIPAGIARR
jgi:hypothetical protein